VVNFFEANETQSDNTATTLEVSELFILGAESTEIATIGGMCKLQPPTFTFSAQDLALTDPDDSTIVKAMITQ
jgi:hypothetical protein